MPVDKHRLRRLASTVSLLTAANLVYAVSQWLAISLIAKLEGPEGVGAYSFAVSLTTPVVLLAQMGGRTLVATDHHGTLSFASVVSLRSILLLFALAILFFAFALSGSHALLPIILGVALSKFIETYSDLAYGYSQRDGRLRQVSSSLLIRSVAGVACFAIALAYTGSLFLATLALSLGWAVAFFRLDLPVLSAEYSQATGDRTGGWAVQLRLGFPIALAGLIVSLNTYVPRYIVAGVSGTSDLGIFAATAYFRFAGTTFISALAQFSLPRLVRAFHDAPDTFHVYLRRLLLIGSSLGLISYLFSLWVGEDLLRMFYSAEFAESVAILHWAMFSTVFAYGSWFLDAGLKAMQCFWPIPWIRGLAAVTNASLCLALLRTYGLEGAAIAMAGAAIVELLAFVVAVILCARRRWRTGVSYARKRSSHPVRSQEVVRWP